MFLFNFIFSIAKHLIVLVGTIACCAFVLGKRSPFDWAAKRIERRNHKKNACTCSYCHH